LWSLDAEVADALFDALEASQVLRRTERELYSRFDVSY
jgi:hypothetical protein